MNLNGIPILNLYGTPAAQKKLVGQFANGAHALTTHNPEGLMVNFPSIAETEKAVQTLHELRDIVMHSPEVCGSSVSMGDTIIRRQTASAEPLSSTLPLVR